MNSCFNLVMFAHYCTTNHYPTSNLATASKGKKLACSDSSAFYKWWGLIQKTYLHGACFGRHAATHTDKRSPGPRS